MITPIRPPLAAFPGPAFRSTSRGLILAAVGAPMLLAAVLCAGLAGRHQRRIAEQRDMAAAATLLAAYTDTRDSLATVGVVAPPGAWPALPANASPVGYRAALYLQDTLVVGEAGLAWPHWLPPSIRPTLDRLDRPFPDHLEDHSAAYAPVKDLDRWDVIGALVLVAQRRRPPLLPLVPLLLGLVATALATGAARRFASRPGIAAGVGTFLPPAALGLALGAPATPGLRLGFAAVLGGAAVPMVVGLSLMPTAHHRLRLREAGAAWAFLTPSLLHLLVFSVGPILFSLYLSFHQWNLLEAARPFVGLHNYQQLIHDGDFWNAVWNTAVYVLFVPVGMAVALALALLVNRRFPGVQALRAIFFLPYITSFVAISLVWKWIYQPDVGLLNHVLGILHIPPQPWLSSPRTALPSLMLMSVWMYAGYMMVIFLAGLQSIPGTLYESARIDGASAWQRFRRITLPLLRPTLFFILVTMVIFMFQVFTAIYVMTEGGPLHATDVIVYHIYRNAWEYLRMGYASAMAWVLFAMVFVITLIQFRFLGRRLPQ